MTTLKTQRAKSMIQSYNYYKSRNNGISLYEIYNDYSLIIIKLSIYKDILKMIDF